MLEVLRRAEGDGRRRADGPGDDGAAALSSSCVWWTTSWTSIASPTTASSCARGPWSWASVIDQAIEAARPLAEAAGHELRLVCAVGADPPERRRGAPRPGVRQPAQQQLQVHRSRRHHHGAGGARSGERGGGHGRRHRRGHSARPAGQHLRHVHAGRTARGNGPGRPRHRADARAPAGADARGLGRGAERRRRAGQRVRGAPADRARARRSGRGRAAAIPPGRRVTPHPGGGRQPGRGGVARHAARIGRAQIVTAHDGAAALEAAAAQRPDVVLLDIGLPLLDGYEVCRRIRQQPWGSGMVLLALTGWGQEEDRDEPATRASTAIS